MLRARLHLFFIHHLHMSPTPPADNAGHLGYGRVQTRRYMEHWNMQFRRANLPMGNARHSHFPCPTHHTGIQFNLHFSFRQFFRKNKIRIY